MAKTIENGNSKNAGTGWKGIQLDSPSTASDETILAELAEYDAEFHSAIGSLAKTADFKVICNKDNDGDWIIIR